jgi:hypothetical protein
MSLSLEYCPLVLNAAHHYLCNLSLSPTHSTGGIWQIGLFELEAREREREREMQI